MKDIGRITQQMPRASSHKDDLAAGGGLARRFGQSVKIALMRRVQPKTIGHADRFLIESLKFGVGQVFQCGRLVQKLAVQQLPTESIRQLVGGLVTACPKVTGYREDVHVGRSTEGRKKSPAGNAVLPAGPGNWVARPYLKENLLVGVISDGSREEPLRFMANPIATFSSSYAALALLSIYRLS